MQSLVCGILIALLAVIHHIQRGKNKSRGRLCRFFEINPAMIVGHVKELRHACILTKQEIAHMLCQPCQYYIPFKSSFPPVTPQQQRRAYILREEAVGEPEVKVGIEHVEMLHSPAIGDDTVREG